MTDSGRADGPGAILKALLSQATPLTVPGVFNGLSARAAIEAGFSAVYMSGFSVAGATWGLPDIGLLTAEEMAGAASRIVDIAGNIPVIADGDNGYGGPMNVARTVRRYEQAGVACIQLEDQVHPKRCGHMENKQVISREEATEKIMVAVDARSSRDFLIMARTDARATHNLDEALARAEAFAAAGADILFIEAPQSVEELRTIGRHFTDLPLAINLVEDGKTPWPGMDEIADLGFRVVLKPVTALLHQASNLAQTYAALRAGDAPDSPRLTFAEFNRSVGLSDANDYIDAVRRRSPSGG